MSMDSSNRAQGFGRLKRELDEDEDTLFMSRDKIRKRPDPIGTQGEEEEVSEGEEQSDDDEDDLEALDEQIQERIDDFECPYDSTSEVLPSHPAFHPGFMQVEQDYIHIVDKAVNHLQSTKYQDAETARLIGMGLSIKEIKYASGTRVALIGNSGVGTAPRNRHISGHRLTSVGKSSVINSLFDTPELAPEVMLNSVYGSNNIH